MSGEWRHSLALGLVHYMAYPELMSGTGPIVEKLAATALDATLSVIEVTHMDDRKVRNEARMALQAAGVRVVFAGTVPLAHSGLALSATDPADRRRAVDFACSLVDEAREVGAELFYLISGPDPGPAKRAQAYRALHRSIRDVCRYARQHSDPGQDPGQDSGQDSGHDPALIAAVARSRPLRLALEPADRDVDHRELTGPYDEVIPIIEDVRRDFPEFGLVVDQSHLLQLGEDPAKVIPRCAPFTWDYHLANVILDDPGHPQYGDKHPGFGVPGSRVGLRELASYIGLIVRTNSALGLARPIVDLEVRTAPGEVPDQVVAAAKQSFLDAWALRTSLAHSGDTIHFGSTPHP